MFLQENASQYRASIATSMLLIPRPFLVKGEGGEDAEESG